MKNLLNYQSSEFDCGPVSVINGIRYLFHREEIYPDLIKSLNLYTLDTCNKYGEAGRHGTSTPMVRFLSCWLNEYAGVRSFPIECHYMKGDAVVLQEGSRLYEAIKGGSTAVLHLYLEVPHYVLVTGIENNCVLLFDPYYEEIDDPDLDQEYQTDEIRFISDQPKLANRSVSLERINRVTRDYYEMGEYEARHALIMSRTSDEIRDVKDIE